MTAIAGSKTCETSKGGPKKIGLKRPDAVVGRVVFKYSMMFFAENKKRVILPE